MSFSSYIFSWRVSYGMAGWFLARPATTVLVEGVDVRDFLEAERPKVRWCDLGRATSSDGSCVMLSLAASSMAYVSA